MAPIKNLFDAYQTSSDFVEVFQRLELLSITFDYQEKTSDWQKPWWSGFELYEKLKRTRVDEVVAHLIQTDATLFSETVVGDLHSDQESVQCLKMVSYWQRLCQESRACAALDLKFVHKLSEIAIVGVQNSKRIFSTLYLIWI